MAVSSKFSIKTQVKSISLPCRSHPTTLQIEELLNKIKTTPSNPSAETICNGLSHLAELYKCMDDLLNFSTTKTLISRQQNKKWIEELIEESVNFLDVCDKTKEIVTRIKDHIKDLHCAIRRRKGELSNENMITKYNSFKKKMKKDVKLLVLRLKQVSGSMVVDSDDNHHLVAVIKAIIGVSEITVSVFESLLLFFSMSNSKPNKWAIVVSKFVHKGMVACEEQQGIVNEFEIIDDVLQDLGKCEPLMRIEKMKIAKCRLEKVEIQIEVMEAKLECVFRCLIGTRGSLLNIMSQ